jgi:acetyl esterase
MSHHRNPRALLTPQMRGVLDRIARAGRPPLHSLTPQQARAAWEASAGVLELSPHKLPRVEDLQIPVRDGSSIPARLYAPQTESESQATGGLPVLLFLHGGGFTVGSINTHDVLCRHLSHLGHCAVLSLGYRLAPEHQFPTAVEDAWDALLWLHEHGNTLALDSHRIAVGGDSAGGTLSAVLALMARDARLPLALQLLFYPGTCGHQDTPSHHTFAEGFLLEAAHVDYFFGLYLRGPQDHDDWRFAPLDGRNEQGYEIEVDDVVPAWIGLAECDMLVDEGVRYADKLRTAGVPVDLEIYRGVVHGFINLGRAIPEALTAHNDAARALRRAFDIALA